MHSRITLILEHHEGHHIPRPTAELYRTPDREVQVWFREADDESSALVGCPECVLELLRGAVASIEDQMAQGRWFDFDATDNSGAAHLLDAARTIDKLPEGSRRSSHSLPLLHRAAIGSTFPADDVVTPVGSPHGPHRCRIAHQAPD